MENFSPSQDDVVEETASSEITSGFDLGPTISWMAENKLKLNEILETRLQSVDTDNNSFTGEIQQAENPQIDENEVRRLINLVPRELRDMSRLALIIGTPSMWFKSADIHTEVQVTPTVSEALSKTAIVTGGASDEVVPERLAIMLCVIPEDIVTDPDIRRLLLAQTVVHEFIHTVLWDIIYEGSQIRLQLADGSIVAGRDYIEKIFGTEAEKFPPISHYSKAYRDDKNKFVEVNGSTMLGIEEELVELLTTEIIGFSSGSNFDITRQSPFDGRESLKPLVDNILGATVVRS